MATQYTEYPTQYPVPGNRFFTWSWAGIFAGTFVYLAIEATFGLLGTAIFASASNPGGAAPGSPGMTTGLQIWMVILSIIALYFAGKTSSKLLFGAADRNLGMYHGLVTFGMCIFSTILIMAIALGSGSTTTYADVNGVPHMHVLNTLGFISSGGEWWLFVAFILSMIASAAGGMHGVRTAVIDRKVATSVGTRPAA